MVSEELTLYSQLESLLFGAMVHAVHVAAPAISADLAAARVFDGQPDPTRVYVYTGHLNLPPSVESQVHAWPASPGSLFDFADKQALYDHAFRPRQLVDDAAYARLSLFKPIEAHTPVVDAYCITCPLANNAWCMFAFLRCGESRFFAPRETEMLLRLKPAILRLVRTQQQRRPRQGNPGDAPETSDHTVLLAKLSQSERHILQLLLAGHTERKIGADLHRSPHTIHVHVKNMYRKLNVNSRRQLQELFGA